MYGLGVSPYANIAPYQAQYAAMANPMLPAFMPTPQPAGGYGGNFVGPDGQIVPIGVLQPQVPVWPVPMGNQNPNPAPQMPNIPQATAKPNNSITNYPGSDRGHSSGPGPYSATPGVNDGRDFLGAARTGRFTALGIGAGIGVDQYGQLHDTVNLDAARAIGSFAGMAVGIPFAGDLAGWGADEAGINQNYVLASAGLQNINAAEVLANPENFNEHQIAVAQQYADAGGKTGIASGATYSYQGIAPDQSTKTGQIANGQVITAPLNSGVVGDPKTRPDTTGTAPAAASAMPSTSHTTPTGIPAGLAAVTTPGKSSSSPSNMGRAMKTEGGTSYSGGTKNPQRTSTGFTTGARIGGSGGPAGQTASKSSDGRGANQGGQKAGR